ncbi:uncharacterized protein LOC107868070 [Capsicum annuum]|uniref:uncharacterized protein LOC107868070 n=1 Tax=Capsicum annuum TaxID=4072 RepID=UPI0007BF7529|nr:uncharacterized protein LOC107868070 [Capsicum annuum]
MFEFSLLISVVLELVVFDLVAFVDWTFLLMLFLGINVLLSVFQLLWVAPAKMKKDKISEHLPKDQELAISYGVFLKILAHPNDAIGKVFGSENSGYVSGLGGNVCPSKAFQMYRNSHVNLGSSSNISHQHVEDFEKQAETLKEKLTGYEETQEKLMQNENHLATLHRFLQSKFGSELPTLN